jgi:plasmid stabilization system protein ParE
VKKVILTKRASYRIEELFKYLEAEWSEKVKNDFIDKFENAIYQIQKYPEIAPKSDIIQNLHKYVVTKQTSIIYRIDKKFITILTIFDNRMDPKNLNKLK